MRPSAIPLAVAAALAAASALAQAAPQAVPAGTEPADRAAVGPRQRMLTHVAAYVFDRLDGLLAPQDGFKLILVAKQTAMAISCEGFDVDPERQASVINGVLAPLVGLSAEGRDKRPYDVAMTAYSVALGGELAVAAWDMDVYCAEAEQLRADFAAGEGDDLRVWKAVE